MKTRKITELPLTCEGTSDGRKAPPFGTGGHCRSLTIRIFRFIACCCGLIAITAGAAPRQMAQDKASAATLLREYHDDIVLIKGKAGGGTGFIADIKGKKFLVSNAHVLAGVRSPTFTTMNRKPLKLGPASVAVGHDLLMFAVMEGGRGIPVAESATADAEMGDSVMVVGCPGHGDVATVLEGKLLGIGPHRVEIDAKFEPGNSGGPIIHIKSGQVVGVTTVAIRDDNLISGGSKWRRYGYRLDSVQGWQAIDWARFYREADALEKIETTTAELRQAISEASSQRRFSRFAQRKFAYESPAIRGALDSFYQTMTQRSPDSERAARSLLAGLRSASKGDVSAANSRFTYDYFRRRLADEAKDREVLINGFAKSVEK